MEIPDGPYAQFHLVTRGQCLIYMRDESLQLFAGDIVVFPKGTAHCIQDNERSQCMNGAMAVDSIVSGKSPFEGDQISTTLICGHFQFDRTIIHPFFSELPDLIHLTDNDKAEFHWLEGIINLIIRETGSTQSGSRAIINKLGEVLFVHVLRAQILKNKNKKGFLAAMADERIGHVLSQVHQFPEKDWRLTSLAQLAGMSRTSFANRFKELINETPLNYVTQWRMIVAQRLLKESKQSVGEIAESVGYQSEAAFNRVFKKRMTLTPLKYRQSR